MNKAFALSLVIVSASLSSGTVSAEEPHPAPPNTFHPNTNFTCQWQVKQLPGQKFYSHSAAAIAAVKAGLKRADIKEVCERGKLASPKK